MKLSFSAVGGASFAAMLTVGAPALSSTLDPPEFSELSKYLVVANKKSSAGDAFNIQKITLGANNATPSTVDPNNAGVFKPGERWPSSGVPEGAGDIFEGIDYSGNVAVTSETGRFSSSNTDFYADLGVQCARDDPATCDQSVSNSQFIEEGEAPASMPANGVTNFDPEDLLTELDEWTDFVMDLTADAIISVSQVQGYRVGGSEGAPLYTNLDDIDVANSTYDDDVVMGLDTSVDDGIAVIDIDVDGDFQLDTIDWVLESTGTTAVFRILNGSNFLMPNSSILMGEGFAESGEPISSIGAYFVHYSEPGDSTDQVLGGGNVILNGIAMHDLNAFKRQDDPDGPFDMASTSVNFQNIEGCAQFVGSTVLFTSSARLTRCSPESAGTNVIPLPASLPLLLAGLGAVGLIARRKAA